MQKLLKSKLRRGDIDSGPIDYAKQHYSNENTTFTCDDAHNLSLQDARVDAVVSFETIEHIYFYSELLSTFFELLKPGGILIYSTPNEDVMPFSKE